MKFILIFLIFCSFKNLTLSNALCQLALSIWSRIARSSILYKRIFWFSSHDIKFLNSTSSKKFLKLSQNLYISIEKFKTYCHNWIHLVNENWVLQVSFWTWSIKSRNTRDWELYIVLTSYNYWMPSYIF